MLNVIENLRIGKAMLAIIRDPNRTEEIFKLSEIGLKNADHPNVKPVVEHALSHPEFRELYERRYLQPPVDVARLASLPEGTLGRAYADFLSTNGLSAVFYPVLEADRPAYYLSMRARQSHDIWHVLTGYPVGVPGELALQAFTLAQLHSGLSALLIGGGLMHLVKKTPAEIASVMAGIAEGFERGRRAKFLLGIPFEEHWELPLDEARRLAGLAA